MEVLALRLAVSLGIGLLIGAERERHKGSGPTREPAGIRTFAIVSLAGGVSLTVGGELALLVATLIVGSLAAIGYARSRGSDPGLTTELALLTTFLLGALALRQPALASGIAVVVTLLLLSRSGIHRFVRKTLSEQEVHDALLLAAAALVVLPLTPDRTVGPFGVLNPRTLWKLVVLVMAIGSAGHIALRTLGPRLGLALSGLASGFVSSAATIGSMGEKASSHPRIRPAAVAGAAFSTVATVVQMAAVLSATSLPTLSVLSWPLLFAGIAAAAYAALFTIRTTKMQSGEVRPGRAFDPKVALLFAATVSFILLVTAGVNHWLGPRGVYIAAALAGFADTHSAAISVASLVAAGKLEARAAVLPILCGLTTNTITKVVVAATTGGRRFAVEVTAGLVIVILAAWAGTLIGG